MTFAVEKTVTFITIITLTIAYLMIVFNYVFKSGIHGLIGPSRPWAEDRASGGNF